jgi:hypothetical protein
MAGGVPPAQQMPAVGDVCWHPKPMGHVLIMFGPHTRGPPEASTYGLPPLGHGPVLVVGWVTLAKAAAVVQQKPLRHEYPGMVHGVAPLHICKAPLMMLAVVPPGQPV